jgi:hypothetical protein
MNEEQRKLLDILKTRFDKNIKRHPGIAWTDVQARLEARPAKLQALEKMEGTGGEPDVIGRDAKTGELTFVDCAAESPTGRRSVCFDPEALEARKEHKPADSAIGMAASMGPWASSC